MAVVTDRRAANGRWALLSLFLVGAVVALSLGIYARVHTPTGRAVYTFGFSGVLQMKAWLATAALGLIVVQLTTALWMWGRLPGAGAAPPWASVLHRWSGALAFVVTLPVAFSCIWSLGFETTTWRVLLHSIAGCLFYGAYAAKMLGLRIQGLPAWVIPVLGGSVLVILVVVWLTAALWFFTQSGLPIT